jgi:hypothetical protein
MIKECIGVNRTEKGIQSPPAGVKVIAIEIGAGEPDAVKGSTGRAAFDKSPGADHIPDDA